MRFPHPAWIGAFAAMTPATAALVSYTFDAGPQQLPDGSSIGITQSYQVESALASVTSVRVDLSLTGSWMGDVHAFLQRGGGLGEASVLINRIGNGNSSANAVAATFSDSASGDIHFALPNGSNAITGSYQPDGRAVSPLSVSNSSPRTAPLSVFAGQAANSTWALNVADVAGGDLNSLNRWTLEMTGTQGTGDTVITPWKSGATTQATIIFANPANDWSTGTVISGGATLKSEADEVIPNGSALTLGSNSNTAGTLQLQGHTETIGGLASAGTGTKTILLGGGTLIVNQAGDSTYDGGLSGAGGLTKSGAGTLTLAGAAAHTGTTDVSGGTLALAASGSLSQTSAVSVTGGTLLLQGQPAGERVADSAGITLAGGKLAIAGNTSTFTETLGALTLSGTGNVIDFGTLSPGAVLAFAASNGSSWAGASLSVWNWTPGVTRLFFGTSDGGLTGDQAGSVSFYSGAGTGSLGTGSLLSSGELVPVPEPGAVTALAALLAAAGWRERRLRR